MSVQVFASAANIDTGPLINAYWSTTTQTSPDQANFNGRGAIIVLSVTGITTGLPVGSIQLVVQGKDSGSGLYYPIFTSAPVSTATNSITPYLIHIDAFVSSTSAKSSLPRTWNIIVKALNNNPASYSVGASVIL